MFLPLWVDFAYRRFPWVTLILILVNVVAYTLVLTGVVDAYTVHQGAGSTLASFLPGATHIEFTSGYSSLLLHTGAEFAPYQLLTSGFLHVDVMHLISTMVFLWVFGRYIEERLGTVRYIIFYFMLMVVAGLSFVLLEANKLPTLGAAGVVSGILGLVMGFAPASQVATLVMLFSFSVKRVLLPAWVALGIWALMGLLGSLTPDGGASAFTGHLGGFLFGLAVAIGMRTGVFVRIVPRLGSHVLMGRHVSPEEERRFRELETHLEIARWKADSKKGKKP